MYTDITVPLDIRVTQDLLATRVIPALCKYRQHRSTRSHWKCVKRDGAHRHDRCDWCIFHRHRAHRHDRCHWSKFYSDGTYRRRRRNRSVENWPKWCPRHDRRHGSIFYHHRANRHHWNNWCSFNGHRAHGHDWCHWCTFHSDRADWGRAKWSEWCNWPIWAYRSNGVYGRHRKQRGSWRGLKHRRLGPNW